MDEVVILRREVRPRMLVFSLFCVAIASTYLDQIFAIEDEEDSMFGETAQAHISQLGSTKEENLNCFLQFDQFVADKWSVELNLHVVDLNSSIVNRLGEDENDEDDEDDEDNRLKVDTRMMLDGLTTCMTNLTEQLKNPWIKKCMDVLLINEIESDSIISDPELFDNTSPLSFSTFLNIRELVQVFFPNKTESDLSPGETEIFKTAVNYSMKHGSSRHKVFVFDQVCEWKNLAALRKREGNIKDMLNVFKQQVMRSVSIQMARAVMNTGDLKPGRWISVYRRWVPVRLQTLKALNSTLNTLEKQRFKTEELCGYVATLANHFSGVELKALLPQRVSPLHLITKDLKDKVKLKGALMCDEIATKECQSFRLLEKSYEEDLRCVESFGELLSRHILNSIVERYHANIVPRITYPEIVCKKSAPNKKIAIRYCRCVGSLCTTRDIGELNSDFYRLNGDVVEKV